MKKKIAMTFVLIFVCYAAYVLITAPSLFDAAWVLAIVSIPASSLVDFLLIDVRNIYINIIAIIIGGIFQYGAIGLLLDKGVDWLKESKSNAVDS